MPAHPRLSPCRSENKAADVDSARTGGLHQGGACWAGLPLSEEGMADQEAISIGILESALEERIRAHDVAEVNPGDDEE